QKSNMGRLPVLNEEHSQFLINHIDMHAAPTVDLAHHELCKAFSDLKISVNAVYKAEILREERDPDKTILKRELYIEKCIKRGVDYQKKLFLSSHNAKQSMSSK
ncbi:hypothetical protein BCV71DRAFT_174536, partial [Rhizopus microsporus]